MKRSAASMTGKPHEACALLLDETLSGKSIVETVKAAGVPIVGFEEFADRGIDDKTLLTRLAKRRDLYLITRDRDFRYKHDVVNTLREAELGAFVLTSAGNKTGGQLASTLIAAWPRIRRFIHEHARPFVAKVRSDGSVEMSVA